MLSSIFIDRPRLAVVISIVITIAGLIALTQIPIAQFPDIVPPQITVTANYAGASAEVVEATVAQPIEVARHRRRQHDLHEVDQRQRRQLHAERHFHGRHRSGSQHRQGAEPRRPGRGAAAAGGARAGHQRDEEIVRAAADHRADVAGRPLRSALPEQLRDHQHHRRLKRVPGVGDVSLLTPSDYSMRVWLDTRPPDELRPDAERHRRRAASGRTSRPRSAASAPSRRCPTSNSSSPSRPRAGSRRSRNSRASSCAPIRTARSCACATWRASSLRRAVRGDRPAGRRSGRA